MTKILILEDDDFIRQQLAGILQEKGYLVVEAASVGQFNNIYEQEEAVIDVFLLDVYLPDGNGFDVCRKIREHGSQIIIFLTSCDDEDSIIKGLDCGGDDYVVKPFRVAELVSRIMANVRRISGGTDIYKDGTLTVDFKNKSIIHADKQICVSPTEFHVLEILINNKGLIVRFHPEKSSYHKEHLPDYGDRYLFSTEYAQPTKELYSKLEKYIDKEYVDYEAFKEGKQVVLFLRDLPEGGYDDTINAGDTLYYNYYRVDENTYGDESNIIDSSYFSIFPYDKAYNRYLLDYNNTHDFNPDYKLMEKLEAAYDACVAPQVAAVVKVTDEVMEDFNGIIPTFGYYTAIASINMAQQAVDRQKDIMERLIGEELSGDMDFELCYNQISIKYDLTSTFSATNNKIGVYFNNNDISYSSNVDIKNTYRTQLINSILQYGITIIAMIVMQLLIMAIVIRNRINRRKEKMMLLHSLGMRRGKIVSVCMLEALRESVWCVITMPLLLLMELLMFTGFVRKL